MNPIDNITEKILAGDKLAVARLISDIEDSKEGFTRALKAIFPHTGQALAIGITGSPGAGKSTLVDCLSDHYRKQGERVGILAVDPSSAFTGGAILGDRIRMQAIATDPGIFIRSMASRGHLGGVANATADAAAVLDAGGYRRIIIETVGVGQDEIDIARTADLTAVVMVPGMGDDIQAIKAGIMEIGDIFVINKADRDGVLRTEREIQSLLSISERADGWTPPIVKTIATEGTGTAELAQAIDAYQKFAAGSSGIAAARRVAVAEHRIVELLRERLLLLALESESSAAELQERAALVATRQQDPYTVVDEIISRLGLGHGW